MYRLHCSVVLCGSARLVFILILTTATFATTTCCYCRQDLDDGFLPSGDDDEPVLSRPKAMFRAKTLSGPAIVPIDVFASDDFSSAPTAAAQDSGTLSLEPPIPTPLVGASTSMATLSTDDNPYKSPRAIAGPGDSGDDEEYVTSFGFGGKRAPSRRAAVKSMKTK